MIEPEVTHAPPLIEICGLPDPDTLTVSVPYPVVVTVAEVVNVLTFTPVTPENEYTICGLMVLTDHVVVSVPIRIDAEVVVSVLESLVKRTANV